MRPRKLFCRALVVSLLSILLATLAYSQEVGTRPVARAFYVLDLLRAGDGASIHSLSTEKLKNLVNEAQLAGLWKVLEGQFGPFKTVTDTTFTVKDSLEIVELVCEFEKGSLLGRFVFELDGKISSFWFGPAPPKAEYIPPEYAKLADFREEDVSFGRAEWKVSGTLSLPKSPPPYPVVILVHGSGPHDRDESLGPNRPFKDLAWGLASSDIAVLRYEKRTKAYAHKIDPMTITAKEEVIDDALEAINFLRIRSDIDSKKIFLFGHSLGGMLAPQIAVLSGKLAGVVMAAAPARPLEELILDQIEYITSLKPSPTPEDTLNLVNIKERVRRLQAQELADTARIIGAPALYFYDLRKRDQVKFAKDLHIPILLLHGERDYQVTDKDLSLWHKNLGDHKNVKIISYSDLNHLFMAGVGKSRPEEYLKQGYVARKVVEELSTWVKSYYGQK